MLSEKDKENISAMASWIIVRCATNDGVSHDIEDDLFVWAFDIAERHIRHEKKWREENAGK